MDLETTVEELAPALLRYGSLVAGDVALGEEAAQEALVALVRRWRRRGRPDSPRLYALAALRRIARRARWRRRLLDPFGAGGEPRHPDPAPDDVAAWRQQLQRVRAAVDRLPARERQALLLVVVAELSTGEAARLLGVTSSAVKMRVHRARKHLETILRSHHEKAVSGSPGASAIRAR